MCRATLENSRAKVSAAPDPGLPVGAASVRIATVSGAEHETTVRSARGGIEPPLSDAEIERKVRDLARLARSRCDVSGPIDPVWDLELPATSSRRCATPARRVREALIHVKINSPTTREGGPVPLLARD